MNKDLEMCDKNIVTSKAEDFAFDLIFGRIERFANPYAFSLEENKEVSASALRRLRYGDKRGKKCNCICPVCGGTMLLISPKNRSSYFRHYDPHKQSSCMQEKSISKINNLRLKSIQDLWDLHKKPFIAISYDGWFILIEEFPQKQENKKQYCRLNKSIKDLILQEKRYILKEEILSQKIWKFVCLYS